MPRQGKSAKNMLQVEETCKKMDDLVAEDDNSSSTSSLSGQVAKSLASLKVDCIEKSSVAINNNSAVNTRVTRCRSSSNGPKAAEKKQISSHSGETKKKKKKNGYTKKEANAQALHILHMETMRNLAIERPPPAPGTYDVNLFNKPTTTVSAPLSEKDTTIKHDPRHELDYNLSIRQDFTDKIIGEANPYHKSF